MSQVMPPFPHLRAYEVIARFVGHLWETGRKGVKRVKSGVNWSYCYTATQLVLIIALIREDESLVFFFQCPAARRI
jgi:hypothetical protein